MTLRLGLMPLRRYSAAIQPVVHDVLDAFAGLHMHYRSVLSKVRSRIVYYGPIRPAVHDFGLTAPWMPLIIQVKKAKCAEPSF